MLPGYGTGAIMAVPAHDARDLEFAQQEACRFAWSTIPRIGRWKPAASASRSCTKGWSATRPPFDGLPAEPATIAKFIAWIEENGWGRAQVSYRLRDWLISRQRYWGTPIPIVYCQSLRHGAGAGGRLAGHAPLRGGIHRQAG